MQNKLLEIFNMILINNGNEKLEKLDESISLRLDLGFDSLNLAELTVRIEDEFGVDIFEDEIIDTIKEVIEKIKKG